MIKSKTLYMNFQTIEDMKWLHGIDIHQEMIECEVISMLGGKKLISIEECDDDATFPFDRKAYWTIYYDEDVEETVAENINELRRQQVMNAL